LKALIWGLGYVGSVSATCLADMGHAVIGIDSDREQVNVLNMGRAPVSEPGLDEMVRRQVAAGRLEAVSDGGGWVAQTDVSLICVGTPIGPDGRADTMALARVATTIGCGLRNSTGYHVVVVRSTVWPGTTGGLIRSILETESGKRAGQDFGLAMNPEFMREGNAIKDFHEPPYHIIGELDPHSGSVVAALYCAVEAQTHHLSLQEAELIKLVNNAFHGLKIGFANEVGRVAAALNLDAYTIMDLVCADRKLNISPNYLRPGLAFGGSCLSKDLRNLLYGAREMNIELPILEAVLPSNRLVIENARQRTRALNVRRVCVLGVSFKSGTDDVRESPALELICNLQEDGMEIRAYDPDVTPSRLTGSNLSYLHRRLPNYADVLCLSQVDALAEAEAVVICKEIPPFLTLISSGVGDGRVPVIKASCAP